ncbi:methionyl-tRNA formyltransferase [Candidatus Peregrinibacteria bacterium]|nr:methionyl-tRNA formyltransferase [Candidatus Peregrinibacteria bacterium]
MNVIFFGTPDFAVPFVKHLAVDNEIELAAVVTQPDKPIGRKQVMTPPPVKTIAMDMGIPVLQPETIKGNPDFLTLIRKLEPDFIIVVAYGMILPQELLSIPTYDCINVHASLLPYYRGASPIQTSLLHGDSETGLSFMSMDQTLDTGDLYLLKKISIKEDDTQETLSKRLADLGATLLPSVLKDIYDGVLTPLPQNEEKATYCSKIEKTDALINPTSMTAREIYNMLRAFTPWPGIYMVYKGKRLKILEAHPVKESPSIKPGTFSTHDKKLLLGTKEGILKLVTLQPEGKKAITAHDFMNGFLS